MSRSSLATILEPQASAPAGGLALLSTPLRCARLACTLRARICLARQAAAAAGRTLQASRGQGSLFPSCDGCPQGTALREALDPRGLVTWHGAGAGWLDRFARGRARSECAAQEAARERQERAGLLTIVPWLDEPPQDEDAHDRRIRAGLDRPRRDAMPEVARGERRDPDLAVGPLHGGAGGLDRPVVPLARDRAVRPEPLRGLEHLGADARALRLAALAHRAHHDPGDPLLRGVLRERLDRSLGGEALDLGRVPARSGLEVERVAPRRGQVLDHEEHVIAGDELGLGELRRARLRHLQLPEHGVLGGRDPVRLGP